jgi:hypothetical protein
VLIWVGQNVTIEDTSEKQTVVLDADGEIVTDDEGRPLVEKQKHVHVIENEDGTITVEEIDHKGIRFIQDECNCKSILQILGEGISVVFKPLGFGESWETSVATILGLVAKEEVVGALGTMSSGGIETAGDEFLDGSYLKGFSFMIFNLLCAPCFAAMGAIRREMNSGKWTAAAIGYMTAFAYAVSLMVYQLGTFFTTGTFTVWTALAVVVLAVFIYLIFRKNKYVKSK